MSKRPGLTPSSKFTEFSYTPEVTHSSNKFIQKFRIDTHIAISTFICMTVIPLSFL